MLHGCCSRCANAAHVHACPAPAVDCTSSVPSEPNVVWPASCNPTGDGGSCVGTCASGYFGTASASCSSGTWSSAINCTQGGCCPGHHGRACACVRQCSRAAHAAARAQCCALLLQSPAVHWLAAMPGEMRTFLSSASLLPVVAVTRSGCLHYTCCCSCCCCCCYFSATAVGQALAWRARSSAPPVRADASQASMGVPQPRVAALAARASGQSSQAASKVCCKGTSSLACTSICALLHRSMLLPLPCPYAVVCSSAPAPANNATWPSSCAGLNGGATCPGSCIKGFAGAATATCNTAGAWDTTSSCEQSEARRSSSIRGPMSSPCSRTADCHLLLLCRHHSLPHRASRRKCQLPCKLQRHRCRHGMHGRVCCWVARSCRHHVRLRPQLEREFDLRAR